MLRSSLLALAVATAGFLALATRAAPTAAVAIESVRLMEVTGKVLIGVAGEVTAVEITSELTPPLRDALLAQARGWKFKPIIMQGRPSAAQAAFRLVLAATEKGGEYEVRIDGIDFGDS